MSQPTEDLRSLYAPQPKPAAVWLELPMPTLPRQQFRKNARMGKEWPGYELHLDYEVVSGQHAGIVPVWLWRYSQANPKGKIMAVTERALMSVLSKQCIGECEIRVRLADGGYYPLTLNRL